MAYMQVVKINDEKFEPVGPILGNKPDVQGEIWLPVIETNKPIDPTYQKRVYVFAGAHIIEHVVTDESLVYIAQRRANYPSIEQQLDTIYHEGIDAWKEQIAQVKEAFPKPSE